MSYSYKRIIKGAMAFALDSTDMTQYHKYTWYNHWSNNKSSSNASVNTAPGCHTLYKS